MYPSLGREATVSCSVVSCERVSIPCNLVHHTPVLLVTNPALPFLAAVLVISGLDVSDNFRFYSGPVEIPEHSGFSPWTIFVRTRL